MSKAIRLQEFADFARSRDIAEGKRQVFELPYAIDGDKVSLCCRCVFAMPVDGSRACIITK